MRYKIPPIEKMKKVTENIYFDEENHRFYKNTDKGLINIPSVTKISGVMDKSEFLVPWAVRSMAEYLDRNWDYFDKDKLIEKSKKEYRVISKQAKDIGSMAHEWIEDFVKGKKPELPEVEEVNKCIQAFLKWYKANKVRPIESEMIVAYEDDYESFGGIIDLVAEVNGILTIVDFKSSKVISKDMRLQTAGYKIAVEQMKNANVIKNRLILRLGKNDGSFEIAESKSIEDEIAFKNALQLLLWKESK